MAEYVGANKNSKWHQFNQVMLPYYFLAPMYILLLVFVLYPTLNVFYYSFQHYFPSKPWITGFAGFENYVEILTNDTLFSTSILNSFKWCIEQVFLQFVFGMIFALVLNIEFKGRGFLRACIFAPWAISGVMVAILWSMIYNQQVGVLNDLLMRLGVIDAGIAWVANPDWAFTAVIVAELWRGIPFFAISLLAALQNVPLELYESCDIDGGGRLAKFWFITWPFLKDTAVLSSLLRVIWEFNSVDLIMNLTGGGPMGLTTILSTYLADTAIKTRNFGYGSAIGVISFFIMTVFALLYLWASKYGKED